MTAPLESSFTFIPAGIEPQAAQEAIKVHILRLRNRHRWPGSGTLCGDDRPQHKGGQVHVWETRNKIKVGKSKRGKNRETRSPSGMSHEPVPTPSASSPQPAAVIASPKSSEADNDPPESNVPCGLHFSQPGLSEAEQTLIKHYLLSAGGSHLPHHFLRSFQASSVSFSAFLAIASFLSSARTGTPSPVQCDDMERQALRAVREQISLSPTTPSAGTMFAVAILANLHEYLNDHDLAACHWAGLVRMVSVNGGTSRLRTYDDLHPFLFWMDALISNSCESPLGRVADTFHSGSATTDHDGQNDRTTTTDPDLAMDELVSLLKRLALHHHKQATDRVHITLSTPIIDILQRPCLRPNEPYSCLKWRRAKMACLLYFVALGLGLHHRRRGDDPTATPTTLSSPCEDDIYLTIVAEVQARQRCYPVQPQELYLIILRASNQDCHCGLIWVVSRLMAAAKQLAPREWNVCYGLLSTSLGFVDTNTSVDMPCQDSDFIAAPLSLSLEVPDIY